jgi:hypothetical protein
MLDVFVRKALAVRALCEPHAFAECAVVGFAVGCVQHGNRVPASDAYWHIGTGYIAICGEAKRAGRRRCGSFGCVVVVVSVEVQGGKEMACLGTWGEMEMGIRLALA